MFVWTSGDLFTERGDVLSDHTEVKYVDANTKKSSLICYGNLAFGAYRIFTKGSFSKRPRFKENLRHFEKDANILI